MSTSHAIEYSKTSKARCHGPICSSSRKTVEQGALRYGKITNGPYGECVQWWHWGCVSTNILMELGASNILNTTGFKKLTTTDQKKVRHAIATRRIAPNDLTQNSVSIVPGSSQGVKRKAGELADDLPNAGTVSSMDKGKQRATSSVLNAMEDLDVDADNRADEKVEELICVLSSNVVGIQYYSGMVGPGEEVRLSREPDNPYDGYAIRVLNIGGAQVGHIPRDIACRVSPLVDNHSITLEGEISGSRSRMGRTYALPIKVKIYATSDKKPLLVDFLRWAAPRCLTLPVEGGKNIGNNGQAGSNTGYVGVVPAGHQMTQAQIEALQQMAELSQMLNGLEKVSVDDESRRESLLDKLCSAEDVLKLPEHKNPPGIANGTLVVDLLKHQKQALQWCIDKEYPKPPKDETPVQFWIYKEVGGKPCYYNIATKTPQAGPPELGRGALCADSMGLGKTLTMISLIVETIKDVPKDFSRTTLIIVPLSVLSNWETQIREHCTQGSLLYYVYYANSRDTTPQELMKYDVVITTYQVVTKEFTDNVDPLSPENATNGDKKGAVKKRKKNLPNMYAMRWKRIILDEGHTIRNPRTKTAQALCQLTAQRRWVVTGTPIINSPKDLGSILSFLKICSPLDSEEYFNRLVIRPLKAGSPEGCEVLRALMAQICIRRTKEMQDSTTGKALVPLPPVEMTMIRVPLEGRARELYDIVAELSRQCFIEHMENSENESVPTNLLGMLTRLRQIALHPGLIPPKYVEELKNKDMGGGGPGPAIKLTVQEKLKLRALLARLVEDSEECPICFGILNDPRITSCSHAFCLNCITESIQRDPKCPMDRRAITNGDLLEPLSQAELDQVDMQPEEEDEDDEDEFRNGSSAKIDHLIYLLTSLPGNEKSLVFSQFTSFLDKIEVILRRYGIPYTRFDGQMSAKERQEVLSRFCRPLDGDEAPIAPVPPPHTDNIDKEASGRSTRASSRSASASTGMDADANSVVDDEKDGDFVVKGDDDDFDDDFDDDLSAWIQKKSKKKGKDRAKAKMKLLVGSLNVGSKGSYHRSSTGENPRVLLISLKAGALGLNLTVANNVFLMDPWWQESIESQAIDRCNRIGQKKKVNVYQLISENTVESKVIEIQEKKKKLIKEAFSGMKGADTQRQRREARMQDLVEVFGIRNPHRRGRF